MRTGVAVAIAVLCGVCAGVFTAVMYAAYAPSTRTHDMRTGEDGLTLQQLIDKQLEQVEKLRAAHKKLAENALQHVDTNKVNMMDKPPPDKPFFKDRCDDHYDVTGLHVFRLISQHHD